MSTFKQKLAASKLVENGGNIGKAMVDAGYSPRTAKTPQKLTNSRGFRSIVKNLVSDVELVKKHRELLYATKLESFDFGNGRETYVKPNYRIRLKALDMYYKLLGYYKSSPKTQIDPYANLSNEELLSKAKELERGIEKMKNNQT